jgi:hypothetical protein
VRGETWDFIYLKPATHSLFLDQKEKRAYQKNKKAMGKFE